METERFRPAVAAEPGFHGQTGQAQPDRNKLPRRFLIGTTTVGAVALVLSVTVPSLLDEDAAEAKNRKRRRRRRRRRNGPSATATPTATGTPTP
jgi:hypothetical protein